MKTIKTGSLVTRIFSVLLSVLIVLSWSGSTYATMPTGDQHNKAKKVLNNRPSTKANVKATKPADTKTTKPVVTKTTKPVVTKTTKPVVTKTTKPVVTKTTKPVVTKTTKPVVTTTTASVVTKTTKPTVTPPPSPSPTDSEEHEEIVEHTNLYEKEKENAPKLSEEEEVTVDPSSIVIAPSPTSATILTEKLLKKIKSYFNRPVGISNREKHYIPDVKQAFVETYNTLPSVGILEEASAHVGGGRVHPKIDENVFKDYPVVTGTTSSFSFVSMQVQKIDRKTTCGADVKGFNGLFTISFVNSTGSSDEWAVVVSDYGIPESRADLIQTCFGKASKRTTPFGTEANDVQYARTHTVRQIEALLLLVQNGEAEWSGSKLKLDEKAFEKLKEHMAKNVKIDVELDPAQIDITK